MSKLDTIYAANPLTALPLDALLYALTNPGSTDNDAGINANDLLAQILGTKIDGVKLTWNSATSITVGIGLLVAENRDVINIASAITKSSLSLSASTWYHVYAYLNSGTPAAEVVTTAPAAWKGTAYSKTGDTSRRYVGSVLTDGSGNVRYFAHNPADNSVRYGRNVMLGAPFRILNAGAAASATAISISGVAPVTAIEILLRVSQSGNQVVLMGESSGLSTSAYDLAYPAIVDDNHIDFPWLPVTSTNIYYMFASAPSGSLSLDGIGYKFSR